jgi:hypothetical protein
MHSFDATFHRLLVKAIEEDRERIRALICDKPVERDTYLAYVGRLEGYRYVMLMAEDVERRLGQGM